MGGLLFLWFQRLEILVFNKMLSPTSAQRWHMRELAIIN